MASQENKREMAKVMYVKNGYTQKKISELVGVSLGTVNRWCVKYEWKKLRTTKAIGKQDALKRLYDQVDEINTKIASKPKGERYADNKDADIIIKLTNAIEKLESETPIHLVYSVFSDAVDWYTNNMTHKQTVEFVGMCDEYLESVIAPKIKD